MRLVPRFNKSSAAMMTASLLLVLVAYNLYYVCQIKQSEIEERREELYELRAQISLAEFSNSQLRAQVAHLSTDAGAEEVAREKLGLVKHGEISFVVLGGESVANSTVAPKVEVERPELSTLDRLMHWFFLG